MSETPKIPTENKWRRKEILETLKSQKLLDKHTNPRFKILKDSNVITIDKDQDWNIDGFLKNNKQLDWLLNISKVRQWTFVQDEQWFWDTDKYIAYKAVWVKEEEEFIIDPETKEKKKNWVMRRLKDNSIIDPWDDEYYEKWRDIDYYDDYFLVKSLLKWDKNYWWKDGYTNDGYIQVEWQALKNIYYFLSRWAVTIWHLATLHHHGQIKTKDFLEWIEQIIPHNVSPDKYPDTLIYKHCLEKRFFKEDWITKEALEDYHNTFYDKKWNFYDIRSVPPRLKQNILSWWYIRALPEGLYKACLEALDIRDIEKYKKKKVVSKTQKELKKHPRAKK